MAREVGRARSGQPLPRAAGPVIAPAPANPEAPHLASSRSRGEAEADLAVDRGAVPIGGFRLVMVGSFVWMDDAGQAGIPRSPARLL